MKIVYPSNGGWTINPIDTKPTNKSCCMTVKQVKKQLRRIKSNTPIHFYCNGIELTYDHLLYSIDNEGTMNVEIYLVDEGASPQGGATVNKNS